MIKDDSYVECRDPLEFSSSKIYLWYILDEYSVLGLGLGPLGHADWEIRSRELLLGQMAPPHGDEWYLHASGVSGMSSAGNEDKDHLGALHGQSAVIARLNFILN
jgi:hypothetical protein